MEYNKRKKLPIEAGIEVGWMKKVIILDQKEFPECTIKEKEFGIIRKHIWYIHRSGEKWFVLRLAPRIESYILK
jgi:hypothetical protein